MVVSDPMSATPTSGPVRINAEGQMTEAPPAPGATSIGWARSKWSPKDGPRERCVCEEQGHAHVGRCSHKRRHGVQHHRRKGPGNPLLCDPCYDAIRTDPGPGGWAGEGFN